ncbi:MAG: DoxX family protein [Halobacteriales archaeon SW_9_67_25]|nr:MAG: DoxX family protein [Halobacteriales archaeon SW_9_67_25]
MMETYLFGAVSASLGDVFAGSGTVAGHVDYVTDEGAAGSVADLLAVVFGSAANVALIGAGAVAVVAFVVLYLRHGTRVPDIAVVQSTLASYRPYLPWMLRLSVGLPLVGAGFAGYLFTPSVPAEGRLLQVTIGFLLLFGLATRPVAAAGLVAYLAALVEAGPPMLLAGEYVAGFLAILVVGPGQPSADMLLRRLVVTDGTIASRLRGDWIPREVLAGVGLGPDAAPVLLRVFLGLNFAYLGVTQKWLRPDPALAVVAKYDLTAVVPVAPELWVFGAGAAELFVGLALVVGLFTRATATVAFLLLTSTLFGLPDDPVLAHVTLFGLSSALMVTGAGPYSLDAGVVPALRRRLALDEAGAPDAVAD